MKYDKWREFKRFLPFFSNKKIKESKGEILMSRLYIYKTLILNFVNIFDLTLLIVMIITFVFIKFNI